MSEIELREILRTNFRYSYADDNWVFPLDDALRGLTADQAAWRPAAGGRGVWDIVLHLAVWNRNIIERIQTGDNVRPAEGAWPDRGDVLGEPEWAAGQVELWESIDALSDLIENESIEKMRASPYGLPDLLCRFTHLAYHTGQIVKLRECQGW